MKRVLVGLALIVINVAVTFAQTKSQTQSPPSASDLLSEAKQAIQKGNAQWSEGWKKGDATMVAAIFADDGVQLTSSGKILRGPQEIAERQKAAMQGADPGVQVTITTVKIWLDGTTAYETGKYKYEYTEKGKPAVDEGRYVTIWKRQKDGSWKLAMDMGVPND